MRKPFNAVPFLVRYNLVGPDRLPDDGCSLCI